MAGGITIVSYQVVGISPVLMNNPAAMAPQGGPATLGKKTIPTPEEEAKAKVYQDDRGHLYLPSMMFRSALLGACSFQKIGKHSAKTIIAGSVFTSSDRVFLIDPKTGKPITKYEISTMRAVVNRAGVQRSRPMVREWACNLDLEIDASALPDAGPVLQLLNIAGRIRGVGDFRPQKSGPYGRFMAEQVDNTVSAKRKAG